MEADLFASQALLDTAATARTAPDMRGLTAQDPRKAAEEFEAMFLTQMFEAMNQGVETEEPFGGGPGDANWRSFLNEAYAQAVVRGGGIGLADRLTAEIIAMQSEETI